MAYTLMAETSRAVDWAALNGAVKPIRKRVELFPIEGPPAGLGLSIPQRNTNELAWEELTQLFDALKRFEMDVYDMVSGAKVTADTIESVKKKFLGE